MSLNFSAEQYQDSYIPKRLSQWEIPKKFSQGKIGTGPSLSGTKKFATLPDEEGHVPVCFRNRLRSFDLTPRSREGYTFSVCDKSGHYLSNVGKPVFKEWSSFVGTWGKDFSKPGAVKGVEVKPGMWICKGGRARWVDAIKIECPKCKNVSYE